MTRKTTIAIVALCVVVALLAGCESSHERASSQAEMTAPRSSPAGGIDGATNDQSRANVRTAQLGIQVPDAEQAEAKINAQVKEWGGYVESTFASDLNGGPPKVDMDIRVPYDKFDDAITSLQSLGKRKYKQITGRDVTAQLAAMKAAQKLDGSSATSQNEYAQLSEDALMPRISLEMLQQGPGVAGTDPNWFAAAWTDTSTLFGMIVRGIVTFALYLFVTAPIWLPGILFLRWIWRKANRTPTATS